MQWPGEGSWYYDSDHETLPTPCECLARYAIGPLLEKHGLVVLGWSPGFLSAPTDSTLLRTVAGSTWCTRMTLTNCKNLRIASTHTNALPVLGPTLGRGVRDAREMNSVLASRT